MGYAVATDAEGSVLVTGGFSGETHFGGIQLSAMSTGFDVFVVKMSSDGNVTWALRFGGDDFGVGTAIATDDGNNVRSADPAPGLVGGAPPHPPNSTRRCT